MSPTGTLPTPTASGTVTDTPTPGGTFDLDLDDNGLINALDLLGWIERIFEGTADTTMILQEFARQWGTDNSR